MFYYSAKVFSAKYSLLTDPRKFSTSKVFRHTVAVMLLHELLDAHPCSKNASLVAWIADSSPVSSPIVVQSAGLNSA